MPEWTATREMAQSAAMKAGEAFAIARSTEEELRAKALTDDKLAERLGYALERIRQLQALVGRLEARIEALETKGAQRHVRPTAKPAAERAGPIPAPGAKPGRRAERAAAS
jgi:hypothetical protein